MAYLRGGDWEQLCIYAVFCFYEMLWHRFYKMSASVFVNCSFNDGCYSHNWTSTSSISVRQTSWLALNGLIHNPGKPKILSLNPFKIPCKSMGLYLVKSSLLTLFSLLLALCAWNQWKDRGKQWDVWVVAKPLSSFIDRSIISLFQKVPAVLQGKGIWTRILF